jgi:hypothetical protein
MKKLYSTLLSLATFTGMNAQFSITATNIPVAGDSYSYYRVTSGYSAGPGATGTAQTYNFASLNVDTVLRSRNFVSPSTTPYASSFTSSSVSQVDTTAYSFYTGTTSSYQFDGMGINDPSFTATVTLNNPGVIFNAFPFAYGASNFDTIQGTAQTSFGPFSVDGDVTTTVDGSGTLNLPNGASFSNVIRLKTVTNLVVAGGLMTIIDTRYQFYNSSQKFALLEFAIVDMAGTIDTLVTVNSSSWVGMVENSQVAFSLFPNPTTSELNIQFNQATANNASIEIINGLGQIVKTETANGPTKKIELAGLSAGFYYVRVTNGKASRVEKLVIE